VAEDNNFLFHIDGLIDGNYVKIETDSKRVLLKVIELMDSAELENGGKNE